MRSCTWLEELASESIAIQAQEDITQPGKIEGRDPGKLYVKISRVFMNIFGYLCSFGTALCVVQDIGSVQVVVTVGCPRKSI